MCAIIWAMAPARKNHRTARPSERLRTWIAEQVHAAEPCTQFPSDAELAHRFGMSVSTVRKVMTACHRRGEVNRVWGCGTFTPGRDETGVPPLPSLRSTTRESLVQAVYQSICRGETRNGDALPSIDFLSRRFGVSSATMVRAYQELQQRGAIVKVGKTFYVGTFGSLTRPGTGKPVFLFRRNSVDFSPVFQTDMMHQAYRTMERVLHEHGYLLHFESTAELGTLIAKWKRSGVTPYGLVFSNMETHHIMDEVLPRIRKLPSRTHGRHPPVLLEGPHKQVQRLKNVFWLSRGTCLTAAARRLAEFLIGRGDRGAVFFFDNEYPTWHLYISPLIPATRIRAELKNLDPDFDCRFFVKKSARVRSTLAFIHHHSAERRADFARGLSKYRDVTVEEFAAEVTVGTDLRAAFAQFDRHRTWVFSREEHAVAAYRRARERGAHIPRDRALIGFENDPRWFHWAITTCQPDWDTVGYLMAHAIIGDFPLPRTTRGYIRTAARVSERLTT